MSRVAQLDSIALDKELYGQFWSEFNGAFNTDGYKEEWELVLKSVVFVCATRFLRQEGSSCTYGSALSGVAFQCRKRTLYVVTVLAGYVWKKITHCVFDGSQGARQVMWLKLYKWINMMYHGCDVTNFLRFLAAEGTEGAQGGGARSFLSPLYRVFNVYSTRLVDDGSASGFYSSSVFAGLEYQNRQLLWNALLELFSKTLLTRRGLLASAKRQGQRQRQRQRRESKTVCSHCDRFPTNPYEMACCRANYCYVCVVKALEWSMCDACGASKRLAAAPVY
ncbi:pex2p [Saccharomyces arboricola H-6]|uniref:RING-type E3 ubiquitin transferase (cysteine targeting) n=1 Tax=Saccharomyces arboricola (strain H-6 / AS 2.3317 / CBS 10644) TaxID=1160507 RepID=J8Q3I9_SACAR|nr:pex2p [Saccharomyces arboricola H-6]